MKQSEKKRRNRLKDDVKSLLACIVKLREIRTDMESITQILVRVIDTIDSEIDIEK